MKILEVGGIRIRHAHFMDARAVGLKGIDPQHQLRPALRAIPQIRFQFIGNLVLGLVPRLVPLRHTRELVADPLQGIRGFDPRHGESPRPDLRQQLAEHPLHHRRLAGDQRHRFPVRGGLEGGVHGVGI